MKTLTSYKDLFKDLVILFAEKDLQFAQRIDSLLVKFAKKVYFATSIEEFTSITKRIDVDLFVTDTNFLELASEQSLLDHKKVAQTPIILIEDSESMFRIQSLNLDVKRVVKKDNFVEIEKAIFFLSALEMQHKKISTLNVKIVDLLDMLSSMIVLTDGDNIEYANDSFIKFVSFENFENFNEKYSQIGDLSTIIVKIDGVVIGDDSKWIEYLLKEGKTEHICYLHDVNENISRAFLTTVAPFPNIANNYIISFSDITQYELDKLYLKEQADKTIELQELINQKLSEIKAKDDLLLQQSKMASMGEMVRAISHQWKQPLSSVMFTIEDIKDRYDSLDEGLKHSLDLMQMQLQFMSETVEDFRVFLNPSKKITLFCIEDAINVTKTLIEPQLRKFDIDFIITKNIPNPEMSFLEGFENEFKHAIFNIINNSKDAIVERKKEKPELEGKIECTISYKDGIIELRIQDNGGGINPTHIQSIFEPNFTTKSDGSGLGLYLSKTIIKNHFCGDMSVQNSNDGALFVIYLKPSMKERVS
ncbi:MAG: sensor histidine kinase [Campylobacterales bacterium]